MSTATDDCQQNPQYKAAYLRRTLLHMCDDAERVLDHPGSPSAEEWLRETIRRARKTAEAMKPEGVE